MTFYTILNIHFTVVIFYILLIDYISHDSTFKTHQQILKALAVRKDIW